MVNYLTFKILGQEVNIISDKTDEGRNTVAVLPDQYYYLGNEMPNIMAAVFAFQEATGYELNQEEINKVMKDNGFI